MNYLFVGNQATLVTLYVFDHKSHLKLSLLITNHNKTPQNPKVYSLFFVFLRWLDVGIAHLTSAPCWVIYLRVLQDAVWPGGELPAVPRPERSPEQREKTRLQCLHCLMLLFPGQLIPQHYSRLNGRTSE